MLNTENFPLNKVEYQGRKAGEASQNWIGCANTQVFLFVPYLFGIFVHLLQSLQPPEAPTKPQQPTQVQVEASAAAKKDEKDEPEHVKEIRKQRG